MLNDKFENWYNSNSLTSKKSELQSAYEAGFEDRQSCNDEIARLRDAIDKIKELYEI